MIYMRMLYHFLLITQNIFTIQRNGLTCLLILSLYWSWKLQLRQKESSMCSKSCWKLKFSTEMTHLLRWRTRPDFDERSRSRIEFSAFESFCSGWRNEKKEPEEGHCPGHRQPCPPVKLHFHLEENIFILYVCLVY